MRLFTAIDFPREVIEKISDICHGIPGVRWTLPEQLHLTLRFIGDANRESCLDIIDELSTIELKAFDITLNGVGQFLNRKKPNILWLGIEMCDELIKLNKAVEKALDRAGLKPERRKFHPHITLARLKSVSRNHLNNYLEQYSSFTPGVVRINEFLLYSSKLRPDGALHTIEERFALFTW